MPERDRSAGDEVRAKQGSFPLVPRGYRLGDVDELLRHIADALDTERPSMFPDKKLFPHKKLRRARGKGYAIDDVREYLARVRHDEVWGYTPPTTTPLVAAASRGGDEFGDAGSAAASIRTVEFRQTLRGYNLDEVDEYLELVAVELERRRHDDVWGYAPPTTIAFDTHRGTGLSTLVSDVVSGRTSAIDALSTVEFRQNLRGYHIDDVDEYLERLAVELRHDERWGYKRPTATTSDELRVPTGPLPLSDVTSGRTSAIDALRTVEFSQTLRGYHIDDVDEYLERVAVEAEVLRHELWRHARAYDVTRGRTPAIDALRTVEFRQSLRGYQIDDVSEYLLRVASELDGLRRNDLWGYGPPTTSMPAPPPTRSGGEAREARPIRVPGPGTEAAAAVTGKAFQAAGFGAFAVSLCALVLVIPLFLVAWAGFFGGSDHARSYQVDWGIALGVIGVGVIGLLARSGTTMDAHGLRRIFLFRIVRLPWTSVQEFTGGVRGRPGLWVTPTARSKGATPFRVPSALHTLSPDGANEVADLVNGAFEFADSARRRVRVGSGDAFESWARRAWLYPLLTLGYATPLVFLVGAVRTMRRGLWLVTVATLDIWVLGIIAGAHNVGGVLGLWIGPIVVLCLAPTVVLFVVGRRARNASSPVGMAVRRPA